jgi:hypothetical protein
MSEFNPVDPGDIEIPDGYTPMPEIGKSPIADLGAASKQSFADSLGQTLDANYYEDELMWEEGLSPLKRRVNGQIPSLPIGHVNSYEYNKVRKWLSAIWKYYGYPIKVGRSVSFPWHLMVSTPIDFMWDSYATRTMWTIYPNWRYRYLVLGYRMESGNPAELLESIPILGSFVEQIQGYIYKLWRVVFNVVSPGGLHNDIIDANWNWIRNYLEYWANPSVI